MTVGAFAPADVLELRDGSRFEGRVLRSDERTILFRIERAAGSIVKEFARNEIRELTFGERNPAPPEREVERDEDAAETDGQAQGAAPAWHFDQMLREVFELFGDEEPQAALRGLQRIVRLAPDGDLARLDRTCRAERGASLAELLARTRLHCAYRNAPPGVFRLSHCTRYESEALGDLLAADYDALLDRAYDGNTIREWVLGETGYWELSRHTRAMVNDARRAAGLIGARIQHDRRLREAIDERRALLAFRRRLTQFVAQVIALPGFTRLQQQADPNDPAERKLQELLEAAATAEAAEAEAAGGVPTSGPSSDGNGPPDEPPAAAPAPASQPTGSTP